jgi:glycosyltransferase involved in cell wall biosynthesis
MRDLVSILIPAYNAEEWIAPTIRSALEQTWPHVELIVVDDGSTDRTLAVARAFESKSVKVFSQSNQGAPAARNAAFDLAQGAYMQWLDADDLLDPQKIACQMAVACQVSDTQILLSGSFGTFFYRPDRAVFARTSLWRDLMPVEYFLTRFTDNVWFQTGAWLASRELCEAAGPWSDVGSPDDDGEYFCRVVAKSAAVKFVEGARAYYRVGNFGSVNNRRSKAALTALFFSKAKCVGHLLSLEDSPRTRAAALRFLQDLMSYFYPEQKEIVLEAERLATALGGALKAPSLKWKYRLVEWAFGYEPAMKLSRSLPRIKTTAAREWDRLLFQVSSHLNAGHSPQQPSRAVTR